MSNLGDMEHIHILPTHQQGDRLFTSQQNGSIITATVLQIPLNDDEEPYVIQDIETGDITEIMKDYILPSNPTSTPTNDLASTFPHIPWLKHDTKITLYINNKMNEPKQSILTRSDGEWYFHQGRTKKNNHSICLNFYN